MNINYMLNLARLPIHFWEVVIDQPSKMNPGTSVLSWCVFRLNNYSASGVPAEIIVSLKECSEFYNKVSIEAIVLWIASQVHILGMTNSKEALSMNNSFQALQANLTKLKEPTGFFDIDLDDPYTKSDSIEVLQSLIDLKQIIDVVTEQATKSKA